MSKNLLLMSSSRTPQDTGWLHHSESDIKNFLRDQGVGKVTFVPYAGVTITHEKYAVMARERFKEMGFVLDSLHDGDPVERIQKAEAIMVGGGNTPKLAELLRLCGIVDLIRDRVENQNIPYLGWSAGAGVACPTIQTTNDWFIVNPESVTLNGLDLFPVNINPHYRDPVEITETVRKEVEDLLAQLYKKVPGLKDEMENRGETRIDRINEFMTANGRSVLGLREGAIVHVQDSNAVLQGTAGAKLFCLGKEPELFEPGDDVSSLLNVA
jgi:dipeptidase E